MTFLDFPVDNRVQDSTKLKDTDVLLRTKPTETAANKILNRVPPKIEPMKSEVLSRAAAFLPQLAASNRAILSKKPEEVNIEKLAGNENQIIEMKLGLGVFEEKSSVMADSSTDSDTDTSSSSEEEDDKRILVLPSEIRAAAAKSQNDPFEKIINSLLFFEGSTDEEDETADLEEIDTEKSDVEMELLEFD